VLRAQLRLLLSQSLRAAVSPRFGPCRLQRLKMTSVKISIWTKRDCCRRKPRARYRLPNPKLCMSMQNRAVHAPTRARARVSVVEAHHGQYRWRSTNVDCSQDKAKARRERRCTVLRGDILGDEELLSSVVLQPLRVSASALTLCYSAPVQCCDKHNSGDPPLDPICDRFCVLRHFFVSCSRDGVERSHVQECHLTGNTE